MKKNENEEKKEKAIKRVAQILGRCNLLIYPAIWINGNKYMILMQKKSKHFFNESQREMNTIRDETSAATTAKTNMENTHFLMKNILDSTLIKVMHYRISILWKTENENCSLKTLQFHFQMERYVLNWDTFFNSCSNSPMPHSVK